MLYALPFVICVLWLIGGQLNKAARRYGVPSVATIASILTALDPHARAAGTWINKDKEKAKRRRVWGAVAWIPVIGILSMGYGVNSWLMRIFKKDLTVRIAYAIILSVPFLIYERITGEPWWFIVPTVIALIGAFLVRGGRLGHIGRFDFLVEDIVRSLIFGGLLSWHLASV